MSDLTRRQLLNTSAGLVTAAAVSAAARWGAAAAGPSNVINVGVIGPGGMGSNHLQLLVARQDVRITHVCDVDANRRADAAAFVEKHGGSAQPVSDLRQVLDDPSVDAVWIATPDHWHSPAGILAVNAGKHAYIEKPVSHNVREGRLLLEAARRNNRVVQVGTQSRSTATVRRAVELIRDGAIGDVLVAKAWNSQLRSSIGKQQPSDPPAHLDFDAWLGPAPKRPYQSNLLHGVWRFWREFGVGDIGNDGVHELDIARWGLGVTTQPNTVAALGSKFFFDDDQEFADTQYCVFEWSGSGAVGQKRQLIYEQRDWSPYVQEGFENGNGFYGTKGMILLGKHGGFQLFGPRNKLVDSMEGKIDLPAHHQNFLDCVRNGGRPHADVEEGHLSASLAHLANIACRVERTLHLDPEAERIPGDAEANALLKRTYREHWATPEGV
ncbi:MAG: Gfo/Idh/MocA family oxidoreductase [Planctomyces sp.]|nr:Gfo/Idh/MocA family oxidoreductase [Planctomyces sp.]